MISVIVYGRNDAHGYNLHRRAALSFNCIAEVLTDPDDEVIFVDYNTPDELPTFIEAISDTLTDQCLDRLRVVRVPAAAHDERFATRTHLPAVEPVARNAAVRRANPSNRWLLLTNTDMIFVPLRGQSMSEICGELEDGFYGLPRFELPEWLWEWLPRSDPRRALAEIGRLGPGIKLDEPTISHEWVRFDGPGDFQLILREDFVAIDGCDEEMILGWHVDSNLSRRLLLHRGSIESLEEQLAGYHCNHNRTRTVYHGSVVTNDLDRFFYSVDEAALPGQRSTWGLADVTLEEVRIRDGLSAHGAAVLSDVIPSGPPVASDAYRVRQSVTYDSGHVLPYVIDLLVLTSLAARVGYIGANPILDRMLSEVVERFGFEHPLAVARFDDTVGLDEILQRSDVFIVDLGLDVSHPELSGDKARLAAAEIELAKLPADLAYALRALHDLVEVERARFEQVKHPRTMMLVNSSAAYCESYVLAQFECSYTTFHSRVRRATVKPADQVDARELDEWFEEKYEELRWAKRHDQAGRLPIRPGKSIDIGELVDYSAFGAGWARPEGDGMWTQGTRSELRVRVDGTDDGQFVLSLAIGLTCVGADELLRVVLLANGEHVAARTFPGTSTGFAWHVELPAYVWAAHEIDFTLVVEEPRSPLAVGWSRDSRLLGIHISRLEVKQVDRSVAVGEEIVFSTASGAERLLGEGWWPVEPSGVWTSDEAARLDLQLTDATATDAELVLDVVPFLTADHPLLEVEMWAQKECVATWSFRYGEPLQPLRVPLSDVLMDTDGRMNLDLRLRHPARPVDLGVGSDPRLLGLHLRSLAIAEPTDGAPEDGGGRPLGRLRKLRAVRRDDGAGG